MIKERKDTMITGGKLLPIISHRLFLYQGEEIKVMSISADNDWEAVGFGKKQVCDHFDVYRCRMTPDGYYTQSLLYTNREVDKEYFYVIYKRVVSPDLEIPINRFLSAHSTLEGARQAIETERLLCENEFVRDTGLSPIVTFSTDRHYYYIRNEDYTRYYELEIWYTVVLD